MLPVATRRHHTGGARALPSVEVPSICRSPCPPAATQCLRQRRGVFAHPPGSGQSRTAMVDGHSQAAKAKTNPRIRHNTINQRELNWSVIVRSHNLVTLLVHQKPLAHTSYGRMLCCQHPLVKALPFCGKPIPTQPSSED